MYVLGKQIILLITNESQKAVKLEIKLKILLGGYQVCVYCTMHTFTFFLILELCSQP